MSSNKVADDLRSMAQEVADLGAGYMRMGRRWLEMQRDQVVDAADAYDAGSGRDAAPGGPGEGRGRRGPGGPGRGRPHSGARGWSGVSGAGMDSFLDDGPTADYVSPGATQSPFASTAGGSQSDYLPPGNETFGRASYRGIGPKNYTRSDQRITEDLCERLTRDHHVDPSDISVNVSGGVVSLGGTVASRWMKHRVEDLAAACDGVRNVENTIQVPAVEEAQASPAPRATPNADADG